MTLADLSSTELSRGYASGEFTPSEVADAVIARVDAREGELNALYLYDPAEVRADAARSTERWGRGEQLSEFDGVPTTVKENLARKGLPQPSGVALPNPRIATENAPSTDRLLEAGAVIVGSTTMPDWGMLSSGVSSLHGITRNALDPALDPVPQRLQATARSTSAPISGARSACQDPGRASSPSNPPTASSHSSPPTADGPRDR